MRIVLLLSLLLLTECHSGPAPKKVDPNAGKHKLSKGDPRTWRTYPVLLLVATKHHIGVDTVAQIVKQFNNRFEGYEFEIDLDVQAPHTLNDYEEDTRPIQEDTDFFTTIGQRLNRPAPEVAAIISDFYLIGAANRDYPEPNSN